MIQVSSEFKKAIKEPERRIKGYVEVLYDLPSVTITPTTNITSTYTNTSEISNGVRVENLYGSVDYLPLDGSYLTMDTTNTNIGFISDDVFENLISPTVTLSFSSTTIKGITLYFRENTPTDLTITYSDSSSDTITNNENNTIQIIFEEAKTLTSVQIAFNDMMYQDRKIYLMEADLGVTQVYKDQDLIDFTIDEEVNKLVEEVPINEANITLNNMSNLFNPLNPKGIVPYLSENTLIKPYIGVLTETLGVEYVKMGEFYFDSYTNNSDATTTLVGKNIIKQLDKQSIVNGVLSLNIAENTIIDGINSSSTETTQAILEANNYNCDVDFSLKKYGYFFEYLKSFNTLNFVKDVASHSMGIFYCDRNNNLVLRNIFTTVLSNITKNDLINDAEYKAIDKINTLIKQVIVPSVNGTISSSDSVVFEKTFELDESPKTIVIEGIAPSNTTISTQNISSYTKEFENAFLVVFNVIGVVGQEAKITGVDNKLRTETKREKTLTTRTTEKEIILETTTQIDNISYSGSYGNDLGQLEYAPSYEISFDYNGDPSLEAGDYINVETPYGYKPLFIQKNRFKFDGGLTGSIEGVE